MSTGNQTTVFWNFKFQVIFQEYHGGSAETTGRYHMKTQGGPGPFVFTFLSPYFPSLVAVTIPIMGKIKKSFILQIFSHFCVGSRVIYTHHTPPFITQGHAVNEMLLNRIYDVNKDGG